MNTSISHERHAAKGRPSSFVEGLGALLRPIASMAMIVVAWEVLRISGVFDANLVPSSMAIVASLLTLVTSESFWIDCVATLGRSLVGLTAACAIGIPAGLVIGSSRLLRTIGMPIVDFMRGIPVTTLYPVFVLTLGIGDRGKIGMIFLGCLLIVILNAALGAQQRSLIRRQVAAMYGATRGYLVFRIAWFEALPSVLAGIRVSIGIALIISTLTEMFMGADSGLGQTLMESYSIYDMGTMYANILSLGIIGFLMNALFARIEYRASQWKTR